MMRMTLSTIAVILLSILLVSMGVLENWAGLMGRLLMDKGLSSELRNKMIST